ncbi:MAG: FKBP-type peptidyl-prolyl cis-trans isomerase [Bacteroidales bacterium]|nr:FKBP-type peptidyl-prolyl cis-trans isomerase [Bacteroidales bacterium]
MKTFKILAAAAVICSAIACSPKEGSAEAQALLPSKAQVDSVSYLLGINFGSFLKGYNFGDDLNYAEIEKGMKDFLAAKGDFRDSAFAKQFKINPEAMNDAFNSFLEKRGEYTKKVNLEKSEAFLEQNKQKEGVQVTESGLQYTIVEPGNDVKPGPKDTVFVHYKGSLIDGTVFDQTPEGGKAVQLLMNRVVSGWTEGLQLVGEGGKINLVLPSELGYGERGTGNIEPNSVLLFEVQLDSVKAYVEKAPKN